MCRICEHQAHHHSESGCQLTTCSCIKFEENMPINPEEKIEIQKNSATQNIREKSDKWALNPQAFKKSLPAITKQELQQDRQVSQSEIWDEVEANWKRIDEFNDDEEYEKLEKELDIILEIKFENISAWIKKGHNYVNLEKYDEAIVCFKTSLILDNKENQKNKKSYEILNFIAMAHRRNDNDDEAIKFCKESLKIKEDFIPAMAELSLNYRNLSQYELSIDVCKKILKIDRNHVDTLDEMGYSYEQLEKYNEAIGYYVKSKQVEGKDPNDVYADKHLAKCYLLKKDFGHAELLINNNKIIENENAYSYQTRGEICQKLEKYEEAIKNYDKEMSYRKEPRDTLTFDLGYCHQQIGNTAISLEYYKKNVKDQGLTGSNAQNLGYGLSIMEENEEAMTWYDQGLEKYPERIALLNNKAKLSEKMKKYDDAIKCRDKISEIKPDDLSRLQDKGYALCQNKKYDEALEIFKQIQSAKRTKDGPSEVEILNDIGWTLIRLEENENGLEYIDNALKIDSTQAYIIDSKCQALRKLNRYEEAVKNYEIKYKITKNEKDRMWIGICLENLGTQEDNAVNKQKYYDDAIKIFDLISEITPKDPYLWLNKGSTQTLLKKYEEAKKNIQKSINLNPNIDVFWEQLAKISYLENNFQQSNIYYDKSLELNPSQTIFHKKANNLYNLNRYEEAITCYDKALEIDFDVKIITDKGDALYMNDKFEEAIACYDKALEIEPEYHQAISNKGNTLRSMKKYDESLEYLNKGILNDKTDFYNFDVKTRLYRDWGKYAESLELCEQMLEQFPDHEETILKHFIKIYKEMNNKNKVEEFQQKLQKLKDLK